MEVTLLPGDGGMIPTRQRPFYCANRKDGPCKVCNGSLVFFEHCTDCKGTGKDRTLVCIAIGATEKEAMANAWNSGKATINTKVGKAEFPS